MHKHRNIKSSVVVGIFVEGHSEIIEKVRTQNINGDCKKKFAKILSSKPERESVVLKR